MTPGPELPAAHGPTTFRGLTLFPFQQRAVQAIFSGKGVVVAAPTGAWRRCRLRRSAS